MKNNTKLIMETWRRFLKEGTEGIDEDGIVKEMSDDDDPSALPPVRDSDLEDRFARHESPHYDKDEVTNDPAGAYGKDAYQDFRGEEMDMYYGDPAHIGQDSSAPMLDEPGDDDIPVDDDSEYITDDDSLNPDIAYDSGSFDDSLDRMP